MTLSIPSSTFLSFLSTFSSLDFELDLELELELEFLELLDPEDYGELLELSGSLDVDETDDFCSLKSLLFSFDSSTFYNSFA
jgi:hypothetical protein